jgi:hypothetical protein
VPTGGPLAIRLTDEVLAANRATVELGGGRRIVEHVMLEV